MQTIKLLSIAVILMVGVPCLAQAQPPEELIYIAVEPCRIADTRKSTLGPLSANRARNFRVAGSASELMAQGGTSDCQSPKQGVAPVAISAYVIAVPAATSTGAGVLTAFPSDQDTPPRGAGSTVNFDAGQTIGNTTNATICASELNCPSDGALAILARNTDQNVVIDVQGYYYPADRASTCTTGNLQGNWQTFFVAEDRFSPDTLSCKIQVDESGRVVSGECDNGTALPYVVTAGQLEISEDCDVEGEFSSIGRLVKIRVARLSLDQNSLTGIVLFNNKQVLFTAERF